MFPSTFLNNKEKEREKKERHQVVQNFTDISITKRILNDRNGNILYYEHAREIDVVDAGLEELTRQVLLSPKLFFYFPLPFQ